MPTLLIVDDSADFRAAARRLLEAMEWTVLGDAEDGAGAVRRATALAPDVVLLDVGLPDADGFDVAEDLARLDRPPRVVMCSTHPRAAFLGRLADTSAAAFLTKAELTGHTLAEALR